MPTDKVKGQGQGGDNSSKAIVVVDREVVIDRFCTTNEYAQYTGISMEFVFQIQTENYNNGGGAVKCL